MTEKEDPWQLVAKLRQQLNDAKTEAETALQMATEAEAARDAAQASSPTALLEVRITELNEQIASQDKALAKAAQTETTLRARIRECTAQISELQDEVQTARAEGGAALIKRLREQVGHLNDQRVEQDDRLNHRVDLGCGCQIVGVDSSQCELHADNDLTWKSHVTIVTTPLPKTKLSPQSVRRLVLDSAPEKTTPEEDEA